MGIEREMHSLGGNRLALDEEGKEEGSSEKKGNDEKGGERKSGTISEARTSVCGLLGEGWQTKSGMDRREIWQSKSGKEEMFG